MKVFSVRNVFADLGPLMTDLEQFCRENGFSEAFSGDVQLAVEEAITNTIKYGYRDKELHSIYVRADIVRDTLILEIEDDGVAFNPLEAPEPDLTLPVEERPIGGLGIYLMRKVTDAIEYERKETRNILRIKKSAASV